MAIAVGRSLLSCGLWEHEDAPVGDATDYTARREDDIACRSGDSEDIVRKIIRRKALEAYSLISLMLRPGRTCEGLASAYRPSDCIPYHAYEFV